MAVLLFFCSFALAYNIQDFLSEENHYLKEDEQLEQPVKIIRQSQAYSVVPVISGESVITFMPLLYNQKEFSTDQSTNRHLFKAAYIIRSYVMNREKASQNPQVKWFLDSGNALLIRNLGSGFLNEINEINIINGIFDDAGFSYDLSEIKSTLTSMSMKCSALNQSMSTALTTEGGFGLETESTFTDDFKDELNQVFSDAVDLQQLANEYSSSVDLLKLNISTSEELTAEEKGYLINLASVPQGFENVSNWALQSNNLETIVNAIYSSASSEIDSLLSEFALRIEMNSAYQAMYETDDELQDLDNQFTSLSMMISIMTNNEYKELWENQTKFSSMQSNWNNAEKSYRRGNYVQAEEYAGKAQRDAKTVFTDGFIESRPAEWFTAEQLIIGAVVLFIVLVAIIILRNKGKIIGSGSSGAKETEVDVYGWEKGV